MNGIGAIELGKRVRERRKELGMNQAELAEQAGLSPSYVSRLEAGQAGDSVAEFIKIAKALSWTIGRMLDEQDGETLVEVRRQLPNGTTVGIIFQRFGESQGEDAAFIQDALASLEASGDLTPPPGETE